MFKEEFEGNWHKLKGKIREKWGKFTNDDVARFNGKYEQFLGELQKKYSYSREQAEREMKGWMGSCGCQGKCHSNKDESQSQDRETRQQGFGQGSQGSGYPSSSDRGEKSKGQGYEKPDAWKSQDKNKNKKRDDDQGYKEHKRKVG